jgi:hypothetical protein
MDFQKTKHYKVSGNKPSQNSFILLRHILQKNSGKEHEKKKVSSYQIGQNMMKK